MGLLVSRLCAGALALMLAVWWQYASALVLLAIISAGLALGCRLFWRSESRIAKLEDCVWYVFCIAYSAFTWHAGLRALRLNAAEAVAAVGQAPHAYGLYALAQYIGDQPVWLHALALLGVFELLAMLCRRSAGTRHFLQVTLVQFATWMIVVFLPVGLAHILAGGFANAEAGWMNPARNLAVIVSPYYAPSALLALPGGDAGTAVGRALTLDGFVESAPPWLLLCLSLAVVSARRRREAVPGIRTLLFGALRKPGQRAWLRAMPWRGRLLGLFLVSVLCAMVSALLVNSLVLGSLAFLQYCIWILLLAALLFVFAWLWRGVTRRGRNS